MHETGVEAFTRRSRRNGRACDGGANLPPAEMERDQRYFAPPNGLGDAPKAARLRSAMPAFAAWVDAMSAPHKQPGYASSTISLKPIGGIPGDATAEQMERSPTWPSDSVWTRSA